MCLKPHIILDYTVLGIICSVATEQILVFKSLLDSPSESLIILGYDVNLKKNNYLSLAVVLVGAGRDSVDVNAWEM